MDEESVVTREFVERRLPWWIAGGAFLIYIIFLQVFLSFEGLSALVKTAGWDWHINLVAPLLQIVTYPIRWLPSVIQLWTLNATGAAFAAITLGLLARSVCLLPSDRTPLQRTSSVPQRFLWIPPAFAALICGLQLSFWENAVVGTGETFNLMVFGWLVTQLLEYRQQRKPRRLLWFAFVYGLAIANNYAMIALFPAFLIAFFWIVGRKSLTGSLVWRIAGCGIAGLALYLVLPALTRWSAPDGPDFWSLMKRHWAFQLGSLQAVPRYIVLLCSLTSLIPVLFIGVVSRKRSSKTKPTAFSKIINAASSLLMHLVFLVACTAAAFDSAFSTRYLMGGRAAALPLYYLGALAIGYFARFFLHVVTAPRALEPGQVPGRLEVTARKIATWVLSAGAAIVVVALAVNTLVRVSGDSARPISRMTRAMAESLPPEGAVVLSDDLFLLYSVQYELLKKSPPNRYVLVHTGSLLSPDYHEFLGKKYRERWPNFRRQSDDNSPIDAPNLMNALLRVDQISPIYYLHPSFGLFFEFFEARPRGMAYQMVRSPANALSGRAIPAEMERQHAYLQDRLAGDFEPLAAKVRNSSRSSGKAPIQPMTDYLSAMYSRMLNHFGVEVQRGGNLERAATYFNLALELHPGNVAAFINLTHNQHLRTGATERGFQAELVKRLQPYEGRWETILKVDGPLDEPISCHNLAKSFADSGHFRQAGRELERVFFFSPDNRSAQLDHGMMCIRSGLPAQAESAAAAYRQRYAGTNLDPKEEVELVRIDAWAEALRRNLPAAERLLEAAQVKYPSESMAWDALVEIYLRFGQESNAVQVMERRLRAQPDNVGALVSFGGLKMRLGQFAEALVITDRALKIDPNQEDGRFNRALIYAALNQWDSAQQEFQALVDRTGARRRIQCLYGLAEVHYQKSNHLDSLRYYREFLRSSETATASEPPSPEVQTARSRLGTLEKQLDYERLAEPGYVVPSTGQLRH